MEAVARRACVLLRRKLREARRFEMVEVSARELLLLRVVLGVRRQADPNMFAFGGR